jgi:transcriptional regulator NrdR family protein
MRCGTCGERIEVVEETDGTWFSQWIVKRRRQCQRCGTAFHTYELPATLMPQVMDKAPLFLQIHGLIEALDNSQKSLEHAQKEGVITWVDSYAVIKK